MAVVPNSSGEGTLPELLRLISWKAIMFFLPVFFWAVFFLSALILGGLTHVPEFGRL